MSEFQINKNADVIDFVSAWAAAIDALHQLQQYVVAGHYGCSDYEFRGTPVEGSSRYEIIKAAKAAALKDLAEKLNQYLDKHWDSGTIVVSETQIARELIAGGFIR